MQTYQNNKRISTHPFARINSPGLPPHIAKSKEPCHPALGISPASLYTQLTVGIGNGPAPAHGHGMSLNQRGPGAGNHESSTNGPPYQAHGGNANGGISGFNFRQEIGNANQLAADLALPRWALELPSDDAYDALIRAACNVEKRGQGKLCLLYTSPSPRDQRGSRMPSSA